tara:strand:- start:515 stop:1030 length:516 start_codon:yes stop_codon:yes gene_type:complete
MDLNRVKSTKDKVIIVQKDKYPNTPVLTVLPHEDKKRGSLKVNRKAMQELGVTDDKKRLILFDDYNVSLTNEPEYRQVLGLVSEERVKGPTKQHKSFQIHMNTRLVKSKEIWKSIINQFDCDTTLEHEFKLVKLEGLDGVFTLEQMESKSEENIEVEVAFDKGETVEITEA